MGIDIRAFISHQLDKDYLRNLPEIIDSWEQVKILKIPNPHCSTDFLETYIQQMAKMAAWECGQHTTFADIEQLWEYYHFRHSAVCPVRLDTNKISCFIGDISVFKNKVEISHWPEHKYANLHWPDIAKMILGMNREIAKALQADKILYFPDSFCSNGSNWSRSCKI